MPGTVDLGISDLEVRIGDHICGFYRAAEREDMLVPFLSAGMRSGDKCICVLDAPRPESLLALLEESRAGDSPRRRQLELVDFENAYLAGGQFVLDRMIEFWEHNVHTALEEGPYGFVRAAGEMTWALRDAPGVEDLVLYEAELNRVAPKYPTVVLCLYDLDRFTGEVIVSIVKTHPKVLIRGMVVENPYYVEPDEFLRYAEA